MYVVWNTALFVVTFLCIHLRPQLRLRFLVIAVVDIPAFR